MTLLKGKKGLITGIANSWSIAWATAVLCKEHGAELAFTYQSENLLKRINPLIEKGVGNILIKCDVTDENSIKNTKEKLEKSWGKVDFILHSIAFSDKDELRGRYIDTSLDNFLNTMHITCYSLTSIAKNFESLMKDGGSIVTLSYYGAQKVMRSYNVMGVAKAALEASVRYLAFDVGKNNIRVNAISAGPVKTLASSAIGDFKSMLEIHKTTSPLNVNITAEDIANAAIYLFSDLSRRVTGEIHYVDSGYNIMGTSLIDGNSSR